MNFVTKIFLTKENASRIGTFYRKNITCIKLLNSLNGVIGRCHHYHYYSYIIQTEMMLKCIRVGRFAYFLLKFSRTKAQASSSKI